MLKLHNHSSSTKVKMLILAFGALCLTLPFGIANSNVLPPEVGGKDDSQIIVEHIRESLPSGGLISIEQGTGRLLFNPTVDKLHSMALKQRFLMPVMVVNQTVGLKLVGELPLSCFMLSANELAHDNYKGYRQHETMRYIRDVKSFPVSRAMICQTVGSSTKAWQAHLDFKKDEDQFVFQEHVSLTAEHFYYFLNTDGSFEMYV